MPFLLLENNITQDDSTHFLLQLLLEISAKQNIAVQHCSSITEATKVVASTTHSAIVIHQNISTLSFINQLRLRSIIKKNNMQWLGIFSFNRAYSFALPQLIVVNNVAKWNIKKELSSSSKIAVVSNAAKQNLTTRHSVPEQNIEVVTIAEKDHFTPVDWAKKQALKMQYAQGTEFFMCVAAGKTYDTAMGILKAFSIFKKWQHSNMKLLIYGSFSFAQKKEWQEKFNTYKYRDDVLLLNEANNSEHAALLASAYAFIHTPLYDEDIMPLLQAMSCETPCLSFFTESAKEYAEDAAIWIEANQYEQLGEKMILLYKDETLRNTMIERGKLQCKIYSIEKAMHSLQAALPLPLFG